MIKIKIKSKNSPLPDSRVFPTTGGEDDAGFVVPYFSV